MTSAGLPTITAFEHSPDGGQGMARDMRVRWALEEVGQPYRARPASFAAMKGPAHRALQPFGQIPTFEGGALTLFETGAIVLHVASCHHGLLPVDEAARARAISWMFAAVSTVEPPSSTARPPSIWKATRPWVAPRLRAAEDRIRGRLSDLSARLGNAAWLDGPFSAGDLMMVDVLRRLAGSGLLEEFSNLAAYVARGEARPAFRRAFDAQRVFFKAHADGAPG